MPATHRLSTFPQLFTDSGIARFDATSQGQSPKETVQSSTMSTGTQILSFDEGLSVSDLMKAHLMRSNEALTMPSR